MMALWFRLTVLFSVALVASGGKGGSASGIIIGGSGGRFGSGGDATGQVSGGAGESGGSGGDATGIIEGGKGGGGSGSGGNALGNIKGGDGSGNGTGGTATGVVKGGNAGGGSGGNAQGLVVGGNAGEGGEGGDAKGVVAGGNGGEAGRGGDASGNFMGGKGGGSFTNSAGSAIKLVSTTASSSGVKGGASESEDKEKFSSAHVLVLNGGEGFKGGDEGEATGGVSIGSEGFSGGNPLLPGQVGDGLVEDYDYVNRFHQPSSHGPGLLQGILGATRDLVTGILDATGKVTGSLHNDFGHLADGAVRFLFGSFNYLSYPELTDIIRYKIQQETILVSFSSYLNSPLYARHVTALMNERSVKDFLDEEFILEDDLILKSEDFYYFYLRSFYRRIYNLSPAVIVEKRGFDREAVKTILDRIPYQDATAVFERSLLCSQEFSRVKLALDHLKQKKVVGYLNRIKRTASYKQIRGYLSSRLDIDELETNIKYLFNSDLAVVLTIYVLF